MRSQPGNVSTLSTSRTIGETDFGRRPDSVELGYKKILRSFSMSRIRLLLLLLCFPLIVGCEGCRDDQSNGQGNGNNENEPIEDFSSKPAVSYPGDSNARRCGIKPGHWMTGEQAIKSNRADIRGDLVSRATVARSNFATGGGFTHQRDGIESRRPVILPKGQERRFDYRTLSPTPTATEQRQLFLSSRFISAGRATFFDTGRQPFNIMSGQEYFFVIFTKRPERFAAFQVANWVKPPRDEFDFKTAKPDYRIVIPDSKNVLPFPDTMLDLTSTAVVFWDNLGPEALTPQQSVALSDWIRWGGQFIINGATASDSISKTSLADLLPLKPTGNIELDTDAAATMLTKWQVKTDRTTRAKIEELKEQVNRIAVDGTLTTGAKSIKDTSNLVLEKRVGRGRVVQPRFDLTDDWLQAWDSYDSFVNSAILLRPSRKTIEGFTQETETRFQQLYVDLGTTESDAVMNTKFRIAARDSILNTTTDGKALAPKQSHALDPYCFSSPITGLSSWNDDSDVIRTCQQVLKAESGIEIPDSSLVVRSLSYYLLLLVPINYLVFRLIGRLEYAWLAVPIIALGGAMWVARAARLDIGFARSQTELALLEIQPDYHRAHLSRVLAIYNSLSSTYDIDFKTYDAAALPMTDGEAKDVSHDYVFETSYNEGPTLRGLSVGSNRIRMVHTEQILDLGGNLQLQGGKLVNNSDHEMLDVFVIDKPVEGPTQIASVGILSPKSQHDLTFESRDTISVSDDMPMQSASLLNKIAAPISMRPGTMRLVGRIDRSMEGMTITPSANQAVAQTIVLAHLKHAPLSEPVPDVNLISDLRRVVTGEKPSDIPID